MFQKGYQYISMKLSNYVFYMCRLNNLLMNYNIKLPSYFYHYVFTITFSVKDSFFEKYRKSLFVSQKWFSFLKYRTFAAIFH